jgi:hypothetical protein
VKPITDWGQDISVSLDQFSSGPVIESRTKRNDLSSLIAFTVLLIQIASAVAETTLGTHND